MDAPTQTRATRAERCSDDSNCSKQAHRTASNDTGPWLSAWPAQSTRSRHHTRTPLHMLVAQRTPEEELLMQCVEEVERQLGHTLSLTSRLHPAWENVAEMLCRQVQADPDWAHNRSKPYKQRSADTARQRVVSIKKGDKEEEKA